MSEKEAKLAVADLIQRAQHGHVAPRSRQTKPRHSSFRHESRVFGQRYPTEMELCTRFPSLIQAAEDGRALKCRLDREGRSFLLALNGHVLGVADLVAFFPGAPCLARNFASSRLPFGKYGIVIGVRQRPVDVTYQVLPFFAFHQSHGVGSS